MHKLTLYLLIFFSSNILSAQDVWGGISVATPDNLNAISGNPAGLGISRGTQFGIYIPFDSVFTMHRSVRFNKFGFDLKYKFSDGKFPNIFNPSDANFGFGVQVAPNTYAGFKWNKENFVDLGLLYRPINQLSIGSVIRYNDAFTTYDQTTIGIAIRPFLNHRLTVGADWKYLNNDKRENDYSILSPHLTLELFDGILLSTRTNNDHDLQINLAFNFGRHTMYSPASSNSTNGYSGGIGFYNYKNQQKSIFKKKSIGTKQYVRMKLSGLFIEEKPFKKSFSFNSSFNPFIGKPEKGIQLRRWIEKIEKLAEDVDVDGIIIDMGFIRAGMAKRLEIRDALMRFQNNNKEIIVYANKGITNKDYFLIAMADKIFINAMGEVHLAGLRMQIPFIRGLLDTLYIVPEVFRVNSDGKSYKTAADPIINRKMSSEMRENYGDLLNDWYDLFIEGVSLRYNGNITKTEEIIDSGPYLFDTDVINAGLADSIMYPDQFDDYINALNDKKVKIIKWDSIDFSDFYVHKWAPEKKEKIAVIYAVGDIISGKSNPGPAGSSIMGDETISKAIKDAREDKDIKAIVLRIDSGGGSALASDQIWREIKKTTEEDTTNIKPFIASMSDVAASGGYYIACQADTIIASPATVTGSIGVIGLRLNFSKLMQKIGINTEWIKKGKHSDFFTGGRLINDYEMEKIQAAIDDIYIKFKNRVRDGRENISDDDDLDQVAMGRVFSGNRALGEKIPFSLIDTTGSFQDAIQIAQNAAGLDNKEIEIIEYPQNKHSFSKLFSKPDARIQSIKLLREILPQELSDQLEALDILPIIMDDEIQMLLPYHITIQ